MSLEKTTQLASIEILFPGRAINAAWHTYIEEDGVVISGPSIHRKAFPNDEISELFPEISDFVSADYLRLIRECEQKARRIAELESVLQMTQQRPEAA